MVDFNKGGILDLVIGAAGEVIEGRSEAGAANFYGLSWERRPNRMRPPFSPGTKKNLRA